MSNGRILIIDDDESVRSIATRVLERSDYEVTACVDGESGVDAYREIGDGVDMVICDMVMPGIGGREVFRQIREMNPEAHILLASGFSVEEDVNNCIAEGAVGYLPKPYDIVALVNAVKADSEVG